MKIPNIIYISAHCLDKDKINLSGIIFQMKITSGTKNPYFIIFPKTNSSGQTSIEKSDLLGQFLDHWEIGLMDYNGSIEQADSVVEFSMVSHRFPSNLKDWPLLKHESTKWSSRKEMIDFYANSQNNNFKLVGGNIFDLTKNNEINIEIKTHHIA